MKEVGARLGVEVHIVHTGQHYDQNMAAVFFDQFGLRPEVVLQVAEQQTAARFGETLRQLSLYFEKLKPELVMVVGDVDSTLAGALAAQKLKLPLAHLESGLRSFDRGMPEEINRILTDEITDLFFVTESSGLKHLIEEGKPQGRIHLVGNTMIDTMVAFEDEIFGSDKHRLLGLVKGDYGLMTFHRPALVDNREGLNILLSILQSIDQRSDMVWPIHPRTKARIKEFGLEHEFNALHRLHLTDPMGYFEFQELVANAAWVLTDSGGIQEETTFRQIPCITLRPNTERPVTVDLGTNTLTALDHDEVLRLLNSIIDGHYKSGEIPPMWDGYATERVMKIIAEM